MSGVTRMRARVASTVTDPRLQLPSDARLAVLGSPISHSKSPAIHTAAYRELGLDWQYGARELQAAELAGFLSGLGEEWRGLSLTMPLKEEAHRLAAVLDPVAQESGVVNTLFHLPVLGGRASWAGFNTDVGGLAAALQRAGLDVRHTLVFGAGATAVSAVLAARRLGASSVTVLARRHEAAQALAARFDGTSEAGGSPIAVSAAPLFADPQGADDGSRPERAARPTLIISTLPGHGIDWQRVAAIGTTPAFDVAYDPWPSPLAKLSEAAGMSAYSGAGMLVEQAILQIRIFVNGDPSLPIDGEPRVRELMYEAAGL